MPQQSRKLLALAAFLALASENVSAFTPNSLNNNRAFPTALSAAGDDVSIDYDAAAKLAYDEWRNTFAKGDFSEDKFKAFKGNYEALTIANVKSAKKARETGTEASQNLELNEYADMTVEDFQKMQAGNVAEESADEPVSPIKAAVDALEAQNVASSTLSEAAEALAKEEEVCIYVIYILMIIVVVPWYRHIIYFDYILIIYFLFFRNLLKNLDWRVLMNLKLHLIPWQE